MANSFDSDDGAAAEVHRSIVETAPIPLSNGDPQTSNGSSTPAPSDTPNSFDNFEINGDGVVQQSDANDAVLVGKHEMGVPVIEEQMSAVEREEVSLKCLTKCATEIQVIDGAELIDPSVLGNGNTNMKQQEFKERKEKKPRRRGGKARRNNEVLSCYPLERKMKKGLQYSREEMEALRFEKLEEQKIKWIEVYCGLEPTVREEYDGLAKLDKIHQEDSVQSFDFDFDPRLQFQKSANLGMLFLLLVLYILLYVRICCASN